MDYKYINIEYLDSVSGGDAEIIREIVIMFKEQSEEIYIEMINNLALKEYTQLGMLAHKAKSSVAIMGMDSLASMLKTFELQAKSGEEANFYESYIARFKDETSKASEELDDLISSRQKLK